MVDKFNVKVVSGCEFCDELCKQLLEYIEFLFYIYHSNVSFKLIKPQTKYQKRSVFQSQLCLALLAISFFEQLATNVLCLVTDTVLSQRNGLAIIECD